MFSWADLIIPCIWGAAIAGYIGYRVGLHYARLEAELNRVVNVHVGDVQIILPMRQVHRLLDSQGLIAQPKGVEKLQ